MRPITEYLFNGFVRAVCLADRVTILYGRVCGCLGICYCGVLAIQSVRDLDKDIYYPF